MAGCQYDPWMLLVAGLCSYFLLMDIRVIPSQEMNLATFSSCKKYLIILWYLYRCSNLFFEHSNLFWGLSQQNFSSCSFTFWSRLMVATSQWKGWCRWAGGQKRRCETSPRVRWGSGKISKYLDQIRGWDDDSSSMFSITTLLPRYHSQPERYLSTSFCIIAIPCRHPTLPMWRYISTSCYIIATLCRHPTLPMWRCPLQSFWRGLWLYPPWPALTRFVCD